jgi:dTDP-glucose pyrophosphorylase
MLNDHVIKENVSIRDVIPKLDVLGKDAVVFVTNSTEFLIGSLTDGDVRRGLIKGIDLENEVSTIMNKNPHFIYKSNVDLAKIKWLRENNFKIIPIIDNYKNIVDIINFRTNKSILPCDVVLMAGGKGTRLLPLTETTPKPLLQLGEKPLIETNLDRLISFGVKNFHISINYLGEQIKNYIGDGKNKNLNIHYVSEDNPLGTIGSLSLIDNFSNDHVLVMNSDLLTSIDFEDFMIDFLSEDCEMSIVGIPYQVNIPYGVLDTQDKKVLGINEKPSFTFYSNGGIYLLKRSVIDLIPKNTFFNATDLIDKLIENKLNVRSYPLMEYWMDIGNHADYKKAQNDIKHLNFK